MNKFLHDLGFHDWNKWEQYNQPMEQFAVGLFHKNILDRPISYIEVRQKRSCKICNIVEDKII